MRQGPKPAEALRQQTLPLAYTSHMEILSSTTRDCAGVDSRGIDSARPPSTVVAGSRGYARMDPYSFGSGETRDYVGVGYYEPGERQSMQLVHELDQIKRAMYIGARRGEEYSSRK